MAEKIVYFSPTATRPWLAIKYAAALADGGADVQVFATADNVEDHERAMVRGNAAFRIFPPHRYVPGAWRHAPLNRLRFHLPSPAMATALVRRRADIYIAGEPADLPMMRRIAALAGARMVYMPFENYMGLSYGGPEQTERDTGWEARYARTQGAWISAGEKSHELRQAAYAMNGPTAVVWNSVPRRIDLAPRGLRARIGATPDTVVLLYTGQVTRSRGLWDVLDAMPLLPDKVHFAVLGAVQVAQFRRAVAEAGLAARVHVLDAVPQDELMGYTAEADIGIIPIQDSCLSYRYCNPAKFFEFVGAGLPLVVRDALVQLREHVAVHGLGEIFTSGSVASLAAAIRRLAEDAAARRRAADNARRFHEDIACWEIQSERLRRAVLGRTRRSAAPQAAERAA